MVCPMDKACLMNQLIDQIKNCRKCPLWKTRTNVVIGEGNLDTYVMFIGEAPGANEDREGRPFCGAAGRVLDQMLEHINLKRSDVYITNVLKCRPPNNRDPLPEEIKACTPYLEKQLEIIRPKIICTLGNYATTFIMSKFGLKPANISRVRGRIFRINTLKMRFILLPTYHPATALYKPPLREVLREDFELLKKIIERFT